MASENMAVKMKAECEHLGWRGRWGRAKSKMYLKPL